MTLTYDPVSDSFVEDWAAHDAAARQMPGFVADASSPCMACGVKHSGRCAVAAQPRVGSLVEWREHGERRTGVVAVVGIETVEVKRGSDHVQMAWADVRETDEPVLPSVVQAFLDAAPTPAAPPIPSSAVNNWHTPLLWRRWFWHLLEGYHKIQRHSKISEWQERYDDAVADLGKDRPKVQAERDAYFEFFKAVVWETGYTAAPADEKCRGFYLHEYEWDEGLKPAEQPAYWHPPQRPSHDPRGPRTPSWVADHVKHPVQRFAARTAAKPKSKPKAPADTPGLFGPGGGSQSTRH